MTLMKTETQIRRRVETAIGIRFRDSLWKYFVKKQYIREMQDGHSEIKVINQIRELLDAAGLLTCSESRPTGMSRRQRRKKMIPARVEATDEFIADLARRDPAVKSFRAQYL